jgi:hypothetical protein
MHFLQIIKGKFDYITRQVYNQTKILKHITLYINMFVNECISTYMNIKNMKVK